MMPTAQEIAYRVYGAWQFARFNAAGAQYFDESRQAALRSFFAAALVAPAFFICQALTLSAAPITTDADPLVIAFVFALYYALYWAAAPVIIYRICVTIDREDSFFRYLSASNWSQVLTTHLQFAVAVLEASGLIPDAAVALPGIIAFVYLLCFQWAIFRHCLDVNPLGAVGFVALRVVVHLLVRSIAIGLVFQQAG